jgi:hypothetical protein
MHAPQHHVHRQVVGWGLALVGTGALFIVQAPAILCFAAAVGLAVCWCRELEAESGQDVAHGSIGDDGHLHVAGEVHDPLHEAAPEQL